MSEQMPQRYPEIIRQIINAEALDGHPESIFVIDPDGRLIYINGLFRESSG